MTRPRYFALAMLVSACANDPDVSSTEQDITFGTAIDTPEVKAVVMLGNGCTGTFIHPQYILTASHCLPTCTPEKPTGCIPGTPKQAMLGDVVGIDGPVRMTADDRLFPGPDTNTHAYLADRVWFPRAAEYDGMTPPDVAVLHTTSPFRGQIIPVMPWGQLPTSGSVCDRWEGHGVDNLGYSDNAGYDDRRRRIGRFDVTCDVRQNQRSFLMEPGGSNLCPGDSGGPSLWRDVSGRLTVGAVNSYFQSGDHIDDNCRDGAVRSGVAFIARHMLERVAAGDVACGGRSWDACVTEHVRELPNVGRQRTSTSGKVVSVSRAPHTLELFWISPDGSVQNANLYEGWSWNRYQLAPPGSAAPDAELSVVSRNATTIELFWVGPNGSVEDANWYEGMQYWNRFQLAPAGSASTTAGVAAISRQPATIELFWVGPSGSVEDAYWYEGMWSWNRFQLAAPGNASTTATLAVASRFPSTMQVWWVSPQGSVEETKWEDGMTSWARSPALTTTGAASTTAGMTALSRRWNTLEIFWVGAFGSVEGAFWYEGMPRWNRYTLAPVGSASDQVAISAMSRLPSTLEVWWATADGAVQDAYWYEGMQGWNRYQLASSWSASPNTRIASSSRRANTLEIWWTWFGALTDAYWYEGMQGWNRYQLAPSGAPW